MWSLLLVLSTPAIAGDVFSTWGFETVAADVAVGTGIWGETGGTAPVSGFSSTASLFVQAGPVALAAGLPWLGQADADIRAHLTFRMGAAQVFTGISAVTWRENEVSAIPGLAAGIALDLSDWPVAGGKTPLLLRAWLWGMGNGVSFRGEAMLGDGPVRLWGTLGSVPYTGPERAYFGIGVALKPWSLPRYDPPPRHPW